MVYNYQTRIMAALRNVSKFMPEVNLCLTEAIHPTERGVRGGLMFICAKCGLAFVRKGVQVDHISPVIPTNTNINEMDWNTVISRLFCPLSNLQVLCKRCHGFKCDTENNERATTRALRHKNINLSLR